MTIHYISCIILIVQGGPIYKIEFYKTPRGEDLAKEFLESLPERPRAKVAAWLKILQEKGPNLHRPYADVLKEPIRELRVAFGRLEIRILYFLQGKSIVLTHGFLKKTPKTPPEEIERAQRYRNDWLLTQKGGY